MKKIFLILALLCFSYFGFSQILVGDVNINKKKSVKFVELVGITKNYKTNVYIDYGQSELAIEEIRDKNGTIARPNSMISVLNLMHKNGWEFVNSWSIGEAGENEVRYLMKKDN